MITTIPEFTDRFREIKDMGWIKTHRPGNTGIGKTLEDLLGISENNIQGPDFGTYELKAARLHSNSMLTLFTKSPQPKGSNTKLRLMYGYASSAYDNNEKVLHATLNATSFTNVASTNNRLKVTYVETGSSDRIYVESNQGICDAYWEVDSLKKNFLKKYPDRLVYVKADCRICGGCEQFYYKEAYLCDGFNDEGFINLIKSGKVYVDLRIGQYTDGRTHDHGTGFRIRECDHDLLFRRKKLV
ncbi:MAG: hypothetical protein K2L82_06760 [Lachnospiraceae bacterium]|nr:hypothetical protein [Lachnospiraceae bacterium]